VLRSNRNKKEQDKKESKERRKNKMEECCAQKCDVAKGIFKNK
jgi:hypothetical protein